MKAGQRFGQLMLLRATQRLGRTAWWCRCTCGYEKVVLQSNLLQRRLLKPCRCPGTAHGQVGTPEYQAWTSMRARCNSPSHRSWKNYGGRGIRICARWDSFQNFLDDMGPRPSPAHTLDRRKNDKGYSKANCRWATWAEQSHNRRNTKLRPRDVRAIRAARRKKPPVLMSVLAQKFGVNQSVISRVASKARWSSV